MLAAHAERPRRALAILAFAVLSRQFLLLVWCTLTFATGLAELGAAGATGQSLLPVIGAFGLLWLAAHLGLAVMGFHGDELLLPLAAMLSGLGLVMILRVEPPLAAAQLVWLALGVVLMLATYAAMHRPTLLRRYKYLAAGSGLALLAVTAVIGHEVNGARLWLGCCGIYIQTAELMKVFLVIFLAGFLEENKDVLAAVTLRVGPLRLPAIPYLGPLLLVWGLTLLLLVWQRDVGATLLLLGVALAMVYVATGKWSFALGGAGLMLLNLVVAYHRLGYVRSRIDVWLDPWSRANDAGYQVVQALYAVAAGGLVGTGLGQGSPGYIPVVATDFIFSALAEELGLAGILALLAIYLVLVFRGLRVALRQLTDFGRLLAMGVATMLGLQTLVIAAGNVGLLPITGITLPWVSYGGSSIIVNFILLGLLLRLSERSF